MGRKNALILSGGGGQEPAAVLDDLMDFSQPAIQRSIKAGFEAAKAVLG